LSPNASALHERALVFDAHIDTLQRVLIEGVDLGTRTDGQADLIRWREGGIDAQVFAVWIDTIFVPHHAARRALQQIDAFHEFVDRYHTRVELAYTGSGVRKIVENGKLAAMLAIEGGAAIQNDLAILRSFHRLGASSMTLTHSASTDWADSSTDKPRHGGLSDFGRTVIREMNRLGMLVDVSHVSDDCVRDVLEVSDAPIIASHSNCRVLSSHPRNLSDELLEAIAERGGVIGINFYAEFVDQAYHDAMVAQKNDLLGKLNTPPQVAPEDLDAKAAERFRTFFGAELPRPPIERLLDQIDHAVKIAGIDHVGLGGDLDSGPIPLPNGIDGMNDYPKVTEGLVSRGYSDESIEKILGANFVRVYEQVTG
jgi:membrane dipeptidase